MLKGHISFFISSFSHFYFVPLHPQNRGVAQLVAFLVWDQAVAGSSPVTSTTYNKDR